MRERLLVTGLLWTWGAVVGISLWRVAVGLGWPTGYAVGTAMAMVLLSLGLGSAGVKRILRFEIEVPDARFVSYAGVVIMVARSVAVQLAGAIGFVGGYVAVVHFGPSVVADTSHRTVAARSLPPARKPQGARESTAWLPAATPPREPEPEAWHARWEDQVKAWWARWPFEAPGHWGKVRYGVGALAALLLAGQFSSWLLPPIPFDDDDEEEGTDGSDRDVMRGRKLISVATAMAQLRRQYGRPGLAFVWGAVRVPLFLVRQHLTAVGSTGSGKTLLLRMFAWSVLRQIGARPDCRALIFDVKQDTYSMLSGMRLACPIHLLNPFDSRATAWDLAADCRSPAIAQQIAAIFFPEDQGQNAFFTNMARGLFKCVLVRLQQRVPGNWSLRDALLAMWNPPCLRQLLGGDVEGEALLNTLKDDKTLANCLAAAMSRLIDFVPIAAIWEHCPARVSMADWIGSDSILVLGWSKRYTYALNAINNVIVTVASDLALSLPDSSTRLSLLLIDEARELGKLASLRPTMNTGRSKGICVALGFQSIEGMREVYGDKEADDLIGQSGTFAFLRTQSATTAEWASKVIGDQIVREHTESVTRGHQQGSRTVQEHHNRREAVMPAELLDLPATNPQNGLTAYYSVLGNGAFRARLRWQPILRQLPPINSTVEDFIARPDEHQTIQPWSEAELVRLGLRPSR